MPILSILRSGTWPVDSDQVGSSLCERIRKAYAEHPDYVPLLERTYQNWKSLEQKTGSQVYFKTGLVYFGKKTDETMKGVHESANKYHIEVRSLTAQETAKRYPQFKLPAQYERLDEPDAGFVTPERSILLFTELAIRGGATILTKTKVLDWKRNGNSITVSTTTGDFSGRKLVITAGPWAGKMIPGMSLKLRVTRQVVAWVKPKRWDSFTLGQFPYGYAETHVMKICMYTNSPVGFLSARRFS